MSPTYGHVTKLFLESEFQYKGKTQTKKKRILSKNFVVFLTGTDSENKSI